MEGPAKVRDVETMQSYQYELQHEVSERAGISYLENGEASKEL